MAVVVRSAWGSVFNTLDLFLDRMGTVWNYLNLQKSETEKFFSLSLVTVSQSTT